MKIAVIGAGISGLGAAYLLSQKHEVDLFEKETRLGGHARTTFVEDEGKQIGMDTGFLVFNYQTYPLLTKLFEKLDVKVEKSDMGFAFWDQVSNIAYNAQTLGGVFFQKKNLFRPSHYKMIFDIMAFNKRANADVESDSSDLDQTLGEYIERYGEAFKKRYLLPMGAAIWSTPSEEMYKFPARTFLQFFKNHGLLGVNTHHQWLTVSNGSINYVNKIGKEISGNIFLGAKIQKIYRTIEGVQIFCEDGAEMMYDKVIFATHAPDTLKLLADATYKEKSILSAFAYKENDALLHTDTAVLYPDRDIYAAWNYKHNSDNNSVTLSYWINKLQNLKSKKEYFVSLNEIDDVKEVIERISYDHPQFTLRAIEAQQRRHEINGENNTYFAGAYWRYGFHEDGLWSANTIAQEFGCAL